MALRREEVRRIEGLARAFDEATGSPLVPAEVPASALPAPRRLLAAGLLAAALAAWLHAAPLSAATTRAQLPDGMVAALTEDQDLFLEAPPLPGEGLYAFARRLTGSADAARQITQVGGKRPRRLIAGVRYRLPYEALADHYKLAVVRALFPDDRALAAGWRHTAGPEGLSLWRLAQWFTGDGQNFAPIREHNRLSDEALAPGQSLVIPRELLLAVFRGTLPPEETAHDLEYVREGSDDFAVYRLRRGEALYSAVVVRFTGGTFAEDVNALAAELAELNGIADVTDMPVGQPVRIPFDLLLPEFLPAGHPRRVEYEKNRSESAKHSNTVRASSLEGITVILDAGHGGQDPGTMLSSTWESVYVYDIMLRVKRLLETTTAATVHATTRDGSRFHIPERDVLPRSRGHAVLTTPPYEIEDARVAANLRWYLANSHHSAAVKRSGDAAKTVFLSIHADSLPSTHRGAMVYIPAAGLTRGEYGKTGAVYAARREVQEKPRVEYSWKERTRSEGLSRQLAASLLDSFRDHDLAIHHEKPIRDRIIRCRRCRPWVPAVVRYNAVPAKLLLEVCNLNNPQDRQLIRTRDFRQKVAVAIADGILAYYGQAPASRPAVAAPR